MSGQRYTPGPWTIRARSPHADHPVHVVEEGTSDVVCELSGSAPSDTVNARLIAAAPEMLAALKQCYLDAIRFLNEGDFKRNVTWDAGYITDIIAKAEGRDK